MNKSKTLQELNLIDSFLFSAFTENTQNAELIAKLIIERTTGKKIGDVSVLSEKQLLGIDPKHHGIRMDLYIMEYEEHNIARVYDIEPNKYNVSELPKRSRYNQDITDVNLLDAGKHYKELPDYIFIWIVSEDPFGKNRMVYTVQNRVIEDNEIQYDDGATKIFLYANGEIGGTDDLRKLLQYFCKSEERYATDKELAELHTMVDTLKHSREMGERYMTLQEMIEYEKEEAYREGKEEGREKGIKEGREEGRVEGYEEAIKTIIISLRRHNIPEDEIQTILANNFKLSDEKIRILLNQ